MVDADPTHVLTMLQFNALDEWTRDEIAAEVNQRHGTDYSGRDVGEVVNSIGDEARNGDPDDVIAHYVSRGLGTAFGEVLGADLSQVIKQLYE